MGLRKEAGNLRLVLVAVEKLFLVRRCSSFAAAASMQSGRIKSKEKDKCLYLCFRDMLGPESFHFKQVIRPIPWNTRDSVGETEKMVDVVEMKYKFYNAGIGRVTTLGSLIVFPLGVHSLDLCWLDTSKRPLQFHRLPHNRRYGDTLHSNNHDLLLGEVGGKLYRLDNQNQRFAIDPDSSAFQVFDPKKAGTGWLPLPNPPFTRFQHNKFDALFLDATNKILGWDCEERELWFFDTTRPEIGWNYVYLDDFLLDEHDDPPFVGLDYQPLFVHNRHPDLGDFHLMFQYHPDTLSVSAHFIPDEVEDYEPVDTQIQLRALCSESDLSEYVSLYKDYKVADYELVHLGTQRVALVLHKYVNQDGGEKPGSVLVVAFEYEFTSTKLPDIKIQTRLIKTRRFQYHYRHPGRPELCCGVRLNGAFLL